MFLLTKVSGWNFMYFVEYVKPHLITREDFTYSRSHEVQFLGHPDFKDGQVPKEPPVLHLAYISNVDIRLGGPVILFNKSHESVNPYTAEVDESYLQKSIEVFEDGSFPLETPGGSRRLRRESWEVVRKYAEETKRIISFQLN